MYISEKIISDALQGFVWDETKKKLREQIYTMSTVAVYDDIILFWDGKPKGKGLIVYLNYDLADEDMLDDDSQKYSNLEVVKAYRRSSSPQQYDAIDFTKIPVDFSVSGEFEDVDTDDRYFVCFNKVQ